MSTYYFTYGANHYDREGKSLVRFYTPIEAATRQEAAAQMTAARGLKWSMNYESKDEAGVERFKLKERLLSSVTI